MGGPDLTPWGMSESANPVEDIPGVLRVPVFQQLAEIFTTQGGLFQLVWTLLA